MREADDIDLSSRALARRALLITAILAISGSGLGVIGILRGTVFGLEIPLILSSLLFASMTLLVLLVGRVVAVQTIATVSTTYYSIYLCAGAIIAVSSTSTHLNLFIYLIWFFPLLVFNKLVNAPAVGRLLAKSLLVAPVLLICCLSSKLIGLFPVELLFLLVAYCLCYECYGLMLNTVSRYREEYIVERERAEALKAESEVLESISDCFISLDSGSRLVYLNDAACTEFAVARHKVLKQIIPQAIPGFFSQAMLAGLREASSKALASVFEARNRLGMKCDAFRGQKAWPFISAISRNQ
jgi:hypothetical protein